MYEEVKGIYSITYTKAIVISIPGVALSLSIVLTIFHEFKVALFQLSKECQFANARRREDQYLLCTCCL